LDRTLRRYTLTNGIKFGGHFLAYRGDPHLVHAAFVVRVWLGDDPMSQEVASAACRAAAGARKRLLIAWPVRGWGDVEYTTAAAVDTLKA
jgi:tRNA splicing endonuclease